MKVQGVFAVLATLFLAVNADRRQCAGTGADNRYEPSGFLTASFTQSACQAVGGTIDASKKGNQKCCDTPNTAGFQNACGGLKPPANMSKFHPLGQPC